MNQNHVESHKRKSNNPRPNYYCNRGDCQKSFSNQLLLDFHLNLHDNNLIKCHYCPWNGARHMELVDHMNHHFLFRPSKCSFCDSTFFMAATRNRHEEDIHEKILDRYQCANCPFITHSRTMYQQHKKRHN